jgi:hypothetical protein
VKRKRWIIRGLKIYPLLPMRRHGVWYKVPDTAVDDDAVMSRDWRLLKSTGRKLARMCGDFAVRVAFLHFSFTGLQTKRREFN